MKPIDGERASSGLRNSRERERGDDNFFPSTSKLTLVSSVFDLKFKPVQNTNCPDFKEAMKIYIQSFPANERQPASVIIQRMRDSFYRMYVGSLGTKVVFFALLHPLNKSKFILLDYMATEKDYRNQRIGTNFIGNFVRSNINKSYILMEVENPDGGAKRRLKKRRVSFYKRRGARILKNVRFLMPPLAGGKPNEMILMIMPTYNRGKISGRLVKKIIYQIYHESYGRGRNDPLLNSFIHHIDDIIQLD